MNTKKAIFYIPIVGFFITSIILFIYGINLYFTMSDAPIGMLITMFLLGSFFLFITCGLTKYSRRAHKIALLFSLLSLISLFSTPDITEFIVVISGLALIIDRKSYSR